MIIIRNATLLCTRQQRGFSFLIPHGFIVIFLYIIVPFIIYTYTLLKGIWHLISNKLEMCKKKLSHSGREKKKIKPSIMPDLNL